jgi:hypothetical protein
MSIAGGIACLIGTIYFIDSHKYIGRAGVGVGGNGITAKYVF